MCGLDGLQLAEDGLDLGIMVVSLQKALSLHLHLAGGVFQAVGRSIEHSDSIAENRQSVNIAYKTCLLYTSDAADE